MLRKTCTTLKLIKPFSNQLRSLVIPVCLSIYLLCGGDAFAKFSKTRLLIVSGTKMRYYCAVDVFGKELADAYYDSISRELLKISQDETSDQITSELGFLLYNKNKTYLHVNHCEGKQLAGEEEIKSFLKQKGIKFDN